MLDKHFEELIKFCKNSGYGTPAKTILHNGAVLIEVSQVKVFGWNRETVNLLFLAPSGYPAAQPDCF